MLLMQYLLQFQVYGFADYSSKDRDERGDEMAEVDSNEGGSGDGLFRMNGNTDKIDFFDSIQFLTAWW